MYQSEEQIGEKVKLDGAGDDEEDTVGECSSQSSSSDSDADIDEELRNQNWSFLRTTRSGRNICQSEVWLVRLVMNDHELQLYNEVHGDRSRS